MSFINRTSWLSAMSLVVGLLLGSTAAGQSFTVNTTADLHDANVGDGVCAAAQTNGLCSLRAAVEEAMALGNTTIAVPKGHYVLSLGPLQLDQDVTIEAISNQPVITANFLSRVLEVSAGRAHLRGLRIERGNSSDPGGAILVSGTGILELEACQIRKSAAPEGAGIAVIDSGRLIMGSAQGPLPVGYSAVVFSYGRGIYARGRVTVVIRDSSITANRGGGIRAVGDTSGEPLVILQNAHLIGNDLDFASEKSGGGLLQEAGFITVADSRFIANSATDAGGGVALMDGHLNIYRSLLGLNRAFVKGPNFGGGGGIYVRKGKLTMDRSRIVKNNARKTAGVIGNGGGVYLSYGDNKDVAISRSEIADNKANSGGGIHSEFHGNDVELTNTTISGNRASLGGGMWTQDGPILNNVTICNNTSTLQPGHDFVGSATVSNSILCHCEVAGFTSLGNNILGPLCAGGDPLLDDIIGLNASSTLAPLHNYGGLTRTHALLPGSPAIDAGNTSSCEATDQRGVQRPQQGDAQPSIECDIGAFERIEGQDTTNGGPSGNGLGHCYKDFQMECEEVAGSDQEERQRCRSMARKRCQKTSGLAPFRRNPGSFEPISDADQENCFDGVDNDADGMIDEADPECGSCTNGVDDDGDGRTDEGDPDCGDCRNGLDDDGDGLVDGADPDCL